MGFKNIFDWINRVDYKFEKVLHNTVKLVIFHNNTGTKFGKITNINNDGTNATTIIECERANVHFVNNYDVIVEQTEDQKNQHYFSQDTINETKEALKSDLRKNIYNTLEFRRKGSGDTYIEQCTKYDLITEYLIDGAKKPNLKIYRNEQLYNLRYSNEFNMDKFINSNQKKIDKFISEKNKKASNDLDKFENYSK